MEKTCFFLAVAICGLVNACTRGVYPLIDVHAHTSAAVSASDTVSAMSSYSVENIIFMEPPGINTAGSSDSISAVAALLAPYGGKFKYMYGGFNLNALVHAIGRNGAITVATIFPNGGDNTADQVARMQALAADVTGTTATFQSNATTAANSGLYVGFGEFGPLHYSRKVGQPSVDYPVNHSLMKWLADLAASKSMFLDIHIEATATSLAQFEELLAHNRNARIIWDHCGWSTSGEATAGTVRLLLERNPNLYLSLKLRPPEDATYANGHPLNGEGEIRKEWLKLLKDHATRIMVGTDPKLDSDGSTPASAMKYGITLVNELLEQLPEETAGQIASGTAKALFKF